MAGCRNTRNLGESRAIILVIDTRLTATRFARQFLRGAETHSVLSQQRLYVPSHSRKVGDLVRVEEMSLSRWEKLLRWLKLNPVPLYEVKRVTDSFIFVSPSVKKGFAWFIGKQAWDLPKSGDTVTFRRPALYCGPI